MVIDAGVHDREFLVKGVLPDAGVMVLDRHRDGVAQIDQVLRAGNFRALQIVAHGSEGEVQLGDTRLNLGNLLNYANTLRSWGVDEISLYACEVASGATGRDFVKQLAVVTGANVAASAIKVGSRALGGTWSLAVQTGAIAMPLMIKNDVLASYVGVLALATPSPVTVNYTTATETITVAANGANTNVSSSAGGGTTTYTNTGSGLQINGGLTGTNTFNVSGVGTGFGLDLIINGSGYTNGDVVNLNANVQSNDFTIDQVQTINVATNVGLTIVDTPDQGDVNWTVGQRINFNSGSSLTTTTGDATGNINLVAKGGLTTVNDRGIQVDTASITSTDGTITLNGSASGVATGTDNYGVVIANANSKVSSVNGAIAITGKGGNGTNSNMGIAIFSGGAVSSTGTGANAATINITGTGSTTATGTGNYGFLIDSNSISSVNGAIAVTGNGGKGTNFNFGVLVATGGAISSTGTGASAATITVTGQADTNTTGNNNEGVRISGANARITSVDGAIAVTGTAGKGTNQNFGVLVNTGGAISSTGTGASAATIKVTGNGSTTATGTQNVGVQVSGTNANIGSINGAITVKGTGGSGTSFNMGVLVLSGGAISSTGTGANAAMIDITGIGSTTATGSQNRGIDIRNTNSKVSSFDGAIILKGTGGTGTISHGIALSDTGKITATGIATVTLTGTGGGTSGDGIRVDGTGSAIQSNSGTISLTGTGSGTGIGINLINGGAVSSTTGNINLLASTINLADTASITTAGNVFINQDNDVPVGATTLGATVNVTAGNLYLNDTIKVDYNSSLNRFDTINLTGAVDLVGSTLNLDLTGYTAPAGNTFYTLINNDGNDAVTGTFTGLAEGAQVGVVGNVGLFITYKGNASSPSLANIGSGNDVQLYVNRPPTDLSLSANSINENVAANSLIGTFSSTDPDAGSSFAYNFVNGTNDNSAFTISGNQLLINASPNFEAKSSYNILVRTTDQGGLSYDKALTININDVNEAPTAVTLNNVVSAIAENTSTTTRIKVANVNITDDALGTNNLSVSGSDASFFEVDATGLYIKAGTVLNYEAKTSYNVTVNVDDPNVGNTPDATTNFTLNVTDVNEAPVLNSALASQSVNNGSTFNYVFGANTFTDPEGIALTYSITGQPSWLTFNSNTRTFGGTANGVGTSTITVSASDGVNATSSSFALIVNQPVVTTTVVNQSNATSGQTILGTAASENIFGSNFNDLVKAGDGNDIIDGNAGNDRLYGEGGDDTLVGGFGTDNLYGGLGSDIFIVQPSSYGLDLVNDFQDGIDFIGLSDTYSGGLTFNSLTFTAFGTGGVSTSIRNNGTEIMRLINVAPNLITNADFKIMNDGF